LRENGCRQAHLLHLAKGIEPKTGYDNGGDVDTARTRLNCLEKNQ
jgi:hypothetical protein